MTKNRRASVFLCLFLATTLTAKHALSEGSRLILDDLSGPLSPSWKEKIFLGKTAYQVVTIDGRRAIRAESRGSASGLVHELDLDPKEMPFLSWSWKIDKLVTEGDVTDKKLDDHTARVYVVFPSLFFWKTRAINYIWASRLPKGMAVASPYTANAMMVAVESGPDKLGAWVGEQRNILEDYHRFFGEPPPRLGAVAIMTDTDDTGAHAIAYYGPISLSTEAGH